VSGVAQWPVFLLLIILLVLVLVVVLVLAGHCLHPDRSLTVAARLGVPRSLGR